MPIRIVHATEPLGLVGGAPVADDAVAALKTRVSRVVAADGGAEALLRSGWMPEAVIGDMDSLPSAAREVLADHLLHEVEEQDSTDFEKCLMRVTAPLILALGFRGGRLDHELAALHGLMRFADQRCMLIGPDDVVFLCPPSLKLDLPAGTPLSLFPLAPVTGRATGLQWSFEQLDFAPGFRVGTSNRIEGVVDLRMSAPAMLCILPNTCLDEAVTQLAAQPGSWPARA
ncbi:MAG: thiamine diphosphokinase [Pseudomonadota bacterium]